jgi:quinol-cytochrome oxidoreductase complex cytochrome b subunit
MFGINDLFQWERFVTPTVIKVFYWLAIVLFVLLGMAGAMSALRDMAFNPFVGLVYLIASLLGALMGIIIARIVAETVLIVFRINEHLGAIRNQGAAANRNPEANYRGQ